MENTWPKITEEPRDFVSTKCAAWHLNKCYQYMLVWARKGTGPIKPTKVGREYLWSVVDIKKILGVP